MIWLLWSESGAYLGRYEGESFQEAVANLEQDVEYLVYKIDAESTCDWIPSESLSRQEPT